MNLRVLNFTRMTAGALAGLCLLALAGCEPKQENIQVANEFSWARSALERNPNIEVVAADAQAGVFTVRIKRTGATQAIKMDELAAGPTSELTVMVKAPASEPAIPSSDTTPAVTEQEALAQAAPEPSATQQSAAASEPAAASSPAPTGKGYTIERNAGKIKVSGPGISIVSSGTGKATTASSNEAGQHAVDPIICEGRRLLHFDNRTIYVDGDAIVARGGCELYITNSHVIAAGTAVIAQDSIVHIANSTIQGNMASFDAGTDAKMYLRGSTFQGLPRRAEKAVVQDQGGNTWK